MLKLFGLEFGNVPGKFRVVLAEVSKLAGVMAVNLRLHRVGAGEGRLLGHQRRGGAKRETGNVPQRLEGCRPHTPISDQRVEALQVTLLLRRHSRDQLGLGAIAAEYRELARVDSRCAIFARLIYAQHRLGVGTAIAGTPAAHARLPRSVSTVISAAPPRE